MFYMSIRGSSTSKIMPFADHGDDLSNRCSCRNSRWVYEMRIIADEVY